MHRGLGGFRLKPLSPSLRLQPWVVDTLQGDQIEVVAFVLWIIDHRTYDKLFGYKGK